MNDNPYAFLALFEPTNSLIAISQDIRELIALTNRMIKNTEVELEDIQILTFYPHLPPQVLPTQLFIKDTYFEDNHGDNYGDTQPREKQLLEIPTDNLTLYQLQEENEEYHIDNPNNPYSFSDDEDEGNDEEWENKLNNMM